MTSEKALETTLYSSQEYPILGRQRESASAMDTPEQSTSRKIRATTDAAQSNGLFFEAAPSRHQERNNISVAVDPVALITTECITVTSAMRKHARWAHSSVTAILGGTPALSRSTDSLRPPTGREQPQARNELSSLGYGSAANNDLLASRWGLRGKKGKSMQDDPLIAAFARLRNDLRGCIGMLRYTDGLQMGVDQAQISGPSIYPLFSIHSSKSSGRLPPPPPSLPWHS